MARETREATALLMRVCKQAACVAVELLLSMAKPGMHALIAKISMDVYVPGSV